jgi:O-antigen/teichoic acid export membrane protein
MTPLDLKHRARRLPLGRVSARERPPPPSPKLPASTPGAAQTAIQRVAYPLYIAANVAPRVAMFGCLMVFTRVLPVQEFGFFALVITLGEILDMTVSNWVRVYILRTDAGAPLSSRRIGRALSLSWGTTVFSLLVAVVTVPMVSAVRDGDLMLGTIAYVVAFSLARLTLTLAQLAQRHAVYAAIESARAVGIILATAVVAFSNIQSFLPASLILSLVTGGICAASLIKTLQGLPKPRLSRRGYQAALGFGLPFMIASLLSYTLGWFDRFIINYFAGPTSVAVYVAAFAIARQPVELLISPFNNYVFPVLVRAYRDRASNAATVIQTGAIEAILAISTAAAGGLTLLAHPLATLFFPADYRASVATLIPFVAVGTLFLMLKQFVFDNSFHITRRVWLLLATMILPALVSIGLGIVLIRRYGDLGAAVTYAISTFIALGSSAIVSLRVLRFEIPWGKVLAIAIAILAAGTVTSMVTVVAAPYGAVAEIILGGLAFVAVYTATLIPFGISVRHLVELSFVPAS